MALRLGAMVIWSPTRPIFVSSSQGVEKCCLKLRGLLFWCVVWLWVCPHELVGSINRILRSHGVAAQVVEGIRVQPVFRGTAFGEGNVLKFNFAPFEIEIEELVGFVVPKFLG